MSYVDDTDRYFDEESATWGPSQEGNEYWVQWHLADRIFYCRCCGRRNTPDHVACDKHKKSFKYASENANTREGNCWHGKDEEFYVVVQRPQYPSPPALPSFLMAAGANATAPAANATAPATAPAAPPGIDPWTTGPPPPTGPPPAGTGSDITQLRSLQENMKQLQLEVREIDAKLGYTLHRIKEILATFTPPSEGHDAADSAGTSEDAATNATATATSSTPPPGQQVMGYILPGA